MAADGGGGGRRARACVCACVHACVRTYVRAARPPEWIEWKWWGKGGGGAIPLVNHVQYKGALGPVRPSPARL